MIVIQMQHKSEMHRNYSDS